MHSLTPALLRAMPYALGLALLPTATASPSYSFSTFNFPDTIETWAQGISDNGQVVGTFRDGSGEHGYVRGSDGSSYLALYGPNGEETRPYGINDNGQVVGIFLNGRGFTCNADGHWLHHLR